MYICPVAHRIYPVDDLFVDMCASRPQIEHFNEEFGSFGMGCLYDLLFSGDKNFFVLIAVRRFPDFESLIGQFDFAADHPRQDVRDFGFGGVGDHRLGNLARRGPAPFIFKADMLKGVLHRLDDAVGVNHFDAMSREPFFDALKDGLTCQLRQVRASGSGSV